MEKICKLVKAGLPEHDSAAYGELVRGAKHFCGKCGLAAREKERLCRPVKMKKKDKLSGQS